MAALLEIIDAILRIYFILVIISILPINPQVVFPSYHFPKPLADFLSWYIRVFGDQVAADKPYWFRGILANELFVILPLCFVNIYAITANKSWFSTTCLIHGVTAYTSLVAILSEHAGESKPPARLFALLAPFFGFALLAIFRGVVPVFMKATYNSLTNAAMKKRA